MFLLITELKTRLITWHGLLCQILFPFYGSVHSLPNLHIRTVWLTRTYKLYLIWTFPATQGTVNEFRRLPRIQNKSHSLQSRPSVIKSVRPSHCGHSLLVVGGRSVSSVCNQILKHSPCPLLIGLTGLIGQVYMCRMSIDSAVLAMPCGVGGGGRSGGVSTSEQGTLNTHPSRGHQLC